MFNRLTFENVENICERNEQIIIKDIERFNWDTLILSETSNYKRAGEYLASKLYENQKFDALEEFIERVQNMQKFYLNINITLDKDKMMKSFLYLFNQHPEWLETEENKFLKYLLKLYSWYVPKGQHEAKCIIKLLEMAKKYKIFDKKVFKYYFFNAILFDSTKISRMKYLTEVKKNIGDDFKFNKKVIDNLIVHHTYDDYKFIRNEHIISFGEELKLIYPNNIEEITKLFAFA